MEIAFPTASAFAGIVERTPKPNAAIAVTAIRLKNVEFDITFLSFVVKKTFSLTAGKEKLSAL
jgi:hypothetical protein